MFTKSHIMVHFNRLVKVSQKAASSQRLAQLWNNDDQKSWQAKARERGRNYLAPKLSVKVRSSDDSSAHVAVVKSLRSPEPPPSAAPHANNPRAAIQVGARMKCSRVHQATIVRAILSLNLS